MIQYIIALAVATTMTLTLSVIFYVYHKKYEKITFRLFAIVVLILTMMGSMLNAFTYYIDSIKTFLSTVVAFNISMEIMIIAVVALGYLGAQGKFKHSKTSDLAIDFLMVWNEGSMGIFLFSLLLPGRQHHISYIISMVSGGLSLYFFIFPMLVEMLYLILLTTESVVRTKMVVLLIASLSPPTLLGDSTFLPFLLLAFLILMSVSTAFLLWQGFIKMTGGKVFFKTFFWVILILVLMIAGAIFGLVSPLTFYASWLPFAFITLGSMTYYFYLALNSPQS